MFQHFCLVLVEFQAVEDQAVSLDDLARGKTDGKTCLCGVILDQMYDCMETAVYGAAVVVLVAEILTERLFLISGDMEGMRDQLVHTLVLGG